MKVRDLLLALVVVAVLYVMIFAPMATSQVPAEAPRIVLYIDMSKVPPEHHGWVRDFKRQIEDQVNNGFKEAFLTVRKCCPTDSL